MRAFTGALLVLLLMGTEVVVHAANLNVYVSGPQTDLSKLRTFKSILFTEDSGFSPTEEAAYGIRFARIASERCGEQKKGGALAGPLLFIDTAPKIWRAIGPLHISCNKGSFVTSAKITRSKKAWAGLLNTEFVADANPAARAAYVIGLALSQLQLPTSSCSLLRLNRLPVKSSTSKLSSLSIPLCTVDNRDFGYAFDLEIYGSATGIDPNLWASLSSLSLPKSTLNAIVRQILLRHTNKGNPQSIVPFKTVTFPNSNCRALIKPGTLEENATFSTATSVRLSCEGQTSQSKAIEYGLTIDSSKQLQAIAYVVNNGRPPRKTLQLTNAWLLSADWSSLAVMQEKDAGGLQITRGFKVRDRRILTMDTGELSVSDNPISFTSYGPPPCVKIESLSYWGVTEQSQSASSELIPVCELHFIGLSGEFGHIGLQAISAIDGLKLIPHESYFEIEGLGCQEIKKLPLTLTITRSGGKSTPVCRPK